MTPPSLDLYSAPLRALRWTPLGGAGGLSGAELYRGDDDRSPLFALKVWPAGWGVAAIRRAHLWMTAAREAGVQWVPGVVPTISGEPLARINGRFVDVCTWMPGRPVAEPSLSQIAAVGHAVAELAWAWRGEPAAGPMTAVSRRLTALATVPWEWRESACEALRRLEPWRSGTGPVRKVHGDLRLEHVLFEGETVVGVIDFGAAGFDHPAVDLARYAADIGPRRVSELCAAYARNNVEQIDPEFVAALAFAGLVVAAARWSQLPGGAAAARAQERAAKLAAWRAFA